MDRLQPLLLPRPGGIQGRLSGRWNHRLRRRRSALNKAIATAMAAIAAAMLVGTVARCYLPLRLGSLMADGLPVDLRGAHPAVPRLAVGLALWEVARQLLGLLLGERSDAWPDARGSPLPSASLASPPPVPLSLTRHAICSPGVLAGMVASCCTIALVLWRLQERSRSRAKGPDGPPHGVPAGDSTTSASGSATPASIASDGSMHRNPPQIPLSNTSSQSSFTPLLSNSESHISLSPWLTKKWSQDSFESFEGAVARAEEGVQHLVQDLIARNRSLEALVTAEQVAQKTSVNKLPDIQAHIRVFCRIRPLLPWEEGQALSTMRKDEFTAEIVRTQTSCDGKLRQRRNFMQFDAVFGPQHSQEHIFKEVEELVQSAVDGYSVTIFTYGQTGAGKTYTMYGGEGDHRGIAPRTIDAVFAKLDDLDAARFCSTVSVNLVELHKNNIHDLLAHSSPPPRSGPMPQPTRLEVRRDFRTGECSVDNVQERVVAGADELLQLLKHGIGQRHVASTVLNPDSSRSHLLLTICLNIFDVETQASFSGKIRICDLAGAERQKKSGAKGEAMKEAIEINKALTALGDVIESAARSKGPIPYRNHKLTQLLSDSLGGSTKTAMFVNVSPSSTDVEETLNSLAYASRVRNITNNIIHRAS